MDEQRDTSRPGAELATDRSAFGDAIRQGDPQAAASAYTETARLLAPSAELIEGRASIVAFWQAGIDAGVVDVDQEPVAVERGDSLAYEVGRYAFRLGNDGTVVDRGSYVLVLEQQADGTWRRAVEMFNPERR